MTRCECKRIIGPYGSWKYEDLINARVKVSSMPVANFNKGFDADQLFTIKDIYFRISVDGKTISVIELNELPGQIFTWKDLEVVGIYINNEENG